MKTQSPARINKKVKEIQESIKNMDVINGLMKEFDEDEKKKLAKNKKKKANPSK